MSNIEKIIKNSKEEMQPMLHSVYQFNSSFLLSKKQEKLLEKILYAISVVDRKFFVLNEKEAYNDNALAIGEGQTISQPSTVARMLLLAELKKGDSVLEIGAGSGWNASLISFLVYPGNVLSIDRIFSLIEKAKKNLKNLIVSFKTGKLKFSKLNFSVGNIFNPDEEWKKTYDKIIFTAGITLEKEQGQEKKVKNIALTLLKNNGILVCPRTAGPLLIYKKKDEKLKKLETKEEYVFVPLLE